MSIICTRTPGSRSPPRSDGEELTEQDLRRQGGLGAVAPARLPAGSGHRQDQGRQPAGDRLHPRRPRHHRVGRHVGGVRGQLAVDHRHRRRLHRRQHAKPEPFGPALDGYAALPEDERRAKAAALAPTLRSIASYDKPMVGHFTDDRAWCWTSWPRAEHPRLAELGTSCPDHFLRTKVKPLVLDLPADARRWRSRSPGCASCTRRTGPTTRPTTTATPRRTRRPSAAPTR